jgi:hypothetical protein
MEPSHVDILKAISDLSAKVDSLAAAMIEEEVSEGETEMAKLEAAAEPAVAEEAKVDEVAAPAPSEIPAETNLSKNDEAGAKAELAVLKIELEASRGIKPLETASNHPISRDEILKAFNAEKDPRRAAEIFKQLNFARK